MLIAKGMLLLIGTLVLFSVFNFKMPKGKKAMEALAGTAIATFLVEAIHNYVLGDIFNLNFFSDVGMSSGSMGGVIAGILVPIKLGINPVYAVIIGASMVDISIIPGFIAGYTVSMIIPKLEDKFPKGTELIIGALIFPVLSRFIAIISTPLVDNTLISIGDTILMASQQSPIIMGFLLGGMIKMICTSPLSSMALTAMLGLQGIAMGIASIASFGGAFTNGMVFKKLKLGDNGKVMAVMLEPLTQVDIITRYPLQIYFSNFIGGGLAGLSAVFFNIVSFAPGTASPIPGMIAPFAFNPWQNVVLSLIFAALGGILAGSFGSFVFSRNIKCGFKCRFKRMALKMGMKKI